MRVKEKKRNYINKEFKISELSQLHIHSTDTWITFSLFHVIKYPVLDQLLSKIQFIYSRKNKIKRFAGKTITSHK